MTEEALYPRKPALCPMLQNTQQELYRSYRTSIILPRREVVRENVGTDEGLIDQGKRRKRRNRKHSFSVLVSKRVTKVTMGGGRKVEYTVEVLNAREK